MDGRARKCLKSEKIILLGPDECQSVRLLLGLGNLLGDSSNEDRL